jgi:hypothetical protein
MSHKKKMEKWIINKQNNTPKVLELPSKLSVRRQAKESLNFLLNSVKKSKKLQWDKMENGKLDNLLWRRETKSGENVVAIE